jgi:hypothetical protein
MRSRLTLLGAAGLLAVTTGCGAPGPLGESAQTSAAVIQAETELLHAPNGDFSHAHPDSYVAYVSWDGSTWCARVYAGSFLHAPNCDWSQAHSDTIIKYQAWDGSLWFAKVNGGTFLSSANGDSSRARAVVSLGYRGWDLSHWTMQLPSTLRHAPNGDFAQAHPGSFAAYLAWDGSSWCTSIYGSTFLHAPNCDWTHAHTDSFINYTTWDGTHWTARMNGRSFLHAPNGDFSQAHTDARMNYRSWDQSNWTMGLQVDGQDCPTGVRGVALGDTLGSRASMFVDADFAGTCGAFGIAIYPAPASFAPVPYDSVTALTVGNGVRAVLSENDSFTGHQYYYDGGWSYPNVNNPVSDHTSALEVFTAQGGPVAALYVGDFPRANPFWAEDVQGLAHHAPHWYISQRTTLQRIPFSTPLSTAPGGPPCPVAGGVECSLGFPAALTAAGYDHFGDLDYGAPNNGPGYLFVPIQGGATTPPAIAAYRVDDAGPVFVGWTVAPSLPVGTGGAAWLAYRPTTQTLVMSEGNLGHDPQNNDHPLYEYNIDMSRPSFLTYKRTISVLDRFGPTTLASISGGAFAPNGQMLYLENGYCDGRPGYISAYYINDGANIALLQARSDNGSGPFNFKYQPGQAQVCVPFWCPPVFCDAEEPEGLDFFDVTGGVIPGMPDSQVHALVLVNNAGADDVFVKHYSY